MSQSFMETVSRWGRRGTAGTSIAASLAFEDVVHGYGGVRRSRIPCGTRRVR